MTHHCSAANRSPANHRSDRFGDRSPASIAKKGSGTARSPSPEGGAAVPANRVLLQEGWVIANHILVSFHVAFISSVLSLPQFSHLTDLSLIKGEVLKFIFFSPETVVSALFMYLSFHVGIAVHELGHFRTAARLTALNEKSQQAVDRIVGRPLPIRVLNLLRLFLLAPYGKAQGIRREGLNYYPDAPYNLAVAAAGPRASRNLAIVALVPALGLLITGLGFDVAWATYLGRLAFGLGMVGILDFLMADPGKYAEFKRRERLARETAKRVEKSAAWWGMAARAKSRMRDERIQTLVHPGLGPVTAPWQFRNCGMGGRHTEKEYPESNISMQEAMFLILGAQDYQEAQEMTVRLQNRLKEIIEKEEGCRVMGIGLEGGLAPYIERGSYPMPEVRLWAMMKQTIEECGYQPGIDVAIALDPALSELEIAYRKEFNVPDSVGMYLFWRDKSQIVMDRDGILELYEKAIREYDIPLLSIEDGFSEDDHEGWQKLLTALGDRMFIIGDDLVTTNDQTIEIASAKGLINTVLIKANQIGTLYETILAMMVSLGKGQDLVVSHRSKSPNDDMEAQIALAVNSLGLKAGGGSNTERLVKYHAITDLMRRGLDPQNGPRGPEPGLRPVVRKLYAYEEPTNAGIPSVGSAVELELAEQGVQLKFKGATPLGTSAGTGEAIHLVDSSIEASEHREVIERHRALFIEVEPEVYQFDGQIEEQQVRAAGDEYLSRLFDRARRYEGKGCLNAVDNVMTVLAPAFEGLLVSDLTLKGVDRLLLAEELRVARRRGKIGDSVSEEELVALMQRKQNLGMNAILSVSLAMARGVAHLQGKDLYELIREEILAITESLASSHGVKIQGTDFADYVGALMEVNAILEEQGEPLYQALRSLTGIYDVQEAGSGAAVRADVDAEPAAAAPLPAAAEPTEAPPSAAEDDAAADPRTDPAPPVPRPDPATPAEAFSILTGAEQAELARINDGLFDAFSNDPEQHRIDEVLQRYVALRQELNARLKRFGLVNNRIYVSSTRALIPYFLGHTLLLCQAPDGAAGEPVVYPVRDGLILTDRSILAMAGFEGCVVDLESELFQLNPERCKLVRVSRIRDMANQLRRISSSANRADAIYLLRLLVIRLSLYSFKKYLNAKNLQEESHNLRTQMLEFLNSPGSNRMPFLVRILVRNISAVATKPKLIDRLWSDTIDLAEVHLRGSDIVNEIRRSTHHAMGQRTLQLVESYLQYLESGSTEGLARLGYPEPGPADRAARGQERPREILTRLFSDLEKLMGNTDILDRLRDWQASARETMLSCVSGKSLQEEVDILVEGVIESRNRWTYYHHLRIIRNRIIQFRLLGEVTANAERRLDRLLTVKPDEPGFDAKGTEAELRRCVDEFVEAAEEAYQDDLFRKLAAITTAFYREEYATSFIRISELRRHIRLALDQRAFPEQRLLLFDLDCLLEEKGYVALRHIASRYDEAGVELTECLDLIRWCALNLSQDGLYSRQLLDLVTMLKTESHTFEELTSVIQQIQRNYQHMLRQLISPFENMRDRLGLNAEELPVALANMQRCLHDLNSMASFADTALSHIEHNIPDHSRRIDGMSTADPSGDDSPPIVHLSHQEQIQALVHQAEAERSVRFDYGGKGSGLIYISYLDIPTPDGFILPTQMTRRYKAEGAGDWFDTAVSRHLETLEQDISRCQDDSRKFAGSDQPILLAVRGGSVISMPGILATVLFVGINDRIAGKLAETDPWHAYDSYRRFLATFGLAVWGVDVEKYDLVEEAKTREGVPFKNALSWEAMRDVVEATKEALRKEGFGDQLDEMLEYPDRQLQAAVQAVMDSWDHPTSKRYRELKGISDNWQTAVIVQEMVSGNRKFDEIHSGMDEAGASLTGVISRSTFTGLGELMCQGEFKFSACGEDLVGGLTFSGSFHALEKLRDYMPLLDRRLHHTISKLRRFMGTDQEVEFTVDRGVLSVLQSRAAEMGSNKVSYAFREPGAEATRGLGIRGSAFRGVVVFDEDDLAELKSSDFAFGEDIDGILMVLENPTPADIPVVLQAEGLLAAKGGSTSHAAIAINSIEHKDYCAVMSARGLRINARDHEATILDGEGEVKQRIRKGDVVSIHGGTGFVYVGGRPVVRT